MAEALVLRIIRETTNQTFRAGEILDEPILIGISNMDYKSHLASNPLTTTPITTDTHYISAQSPLPPLLDPNTADQMDQFVHQQTMINVEMTTLERTDWVILFTCMVVIASGGNLIVIHIVCTNREMKSVTNKFLVNLSFADTMVSTLNVIFNFISMLNR